MWSLLFANLRWLLVPVALVIVLGAYGKGRVDQEATCRAAELAQEVADLKAVMVAQDKAKADAEAKAIALGVLAQDLSAKVQDYEVSLLHPVPQPSKPAGAGDQARSAPAPPVSGGCVLGDDAARRLRDIR